MKNSFNGEKYANEGEKSGFRKYIELSNYAIVIWVVFQEYWTRIVKNGDKLIRSRSQG